MEAHVPTVIHEPERIARAPVVWISIWALLFAAVLGVIARTVFEVRSSTIRSEGAQRIQKPGAMVSNIRTELYEGRPGRGEVDKAQQRRALGQFSWVDRERGLVRIPIDEAIDLELAEQPQ
jgi:hypothetical protein